MPIQRSDSIPEVDFLNESFHDEVENLDVPSEFKVKELNCELLPEPLLAEDKTRFVLFPIKQPDVILLQPPNPFYYYLSFFFLLIAFNIY